MSQINTIKNSAFHKLYKATILPRAQKKFDLLMPLLLPKSSVADIGCGNGGLGFLLIKAGFNVKGFDIVENSFFDELKPTIFNGKEIKCEQKFDYALLITVLHHTTNQKELLLEAKRIGKTIIVMEDVFTHKMGEKITHFTDSLVNFEFKGHPHSNRTKANWEAFFDELGFVLIKTINTRTLLFFRQVIFVLEPKLDQ